MRTFLVLFLTACGGGAPAPTATAPKAAAPAAPVEAAVGPEGPSDLAVPDIGAISTDAALIATGEAAFSSKGCIACHAFGSKLVGPDLTSVTDRRETLWIERMVRHPDQMTKRDPVAKGLLKTHMVQMPDQKVTDEELGQILAYLNSRKGS